MSLRRRKRRQNRIAKMQVPATRTARTVLAPVRSRGLRNIFRSFESRDEIRPTRTVMAAPAERRRLVPASLRRASNRANKAVLSDRNNIGLISGPVLGKIVVDLPRHHPVCVARRERRQVMFAKRKAGKSGQKPRKPSVIIRCE